MVAKIPIRTVYTGAAATGLAEFQSGEFLDYPVGGTGQTTLGTANQVLATNAGATAIEWQDPTVGDITGVTAGTGLSGGGTSGTVTLNVDAAQTQITSVGTIGTGTWQGTAVADAYVANDLTISGGTVNNSVIGASTAAAGTFTQVDIEATGDLRLQDTTGGQYVALQAPGTVSTSWTATLPAAVGSSGQALRTSDGSGTLEWFTPETGDITGVTAGTGLSGGGTSGVVTLNVDAAQTQITSVGTIGTGTWQGTAIANAYLANSTTSVGGVTLTLGGTDATPAFNLSDATAYPGDSSLVTTGTVDSGTWQGTAVADAYVADDLTISGGTINNSVIGGTTAAAGTFTQVDVEAQGDLRLQDTTGGQYVALQAPGTVSTSWTATFPAAVGSSGQALRTSDGSGTLEWFTPEVGDITGVTAGSGLTGGGTSGTVTLNIGVGAGITLNADSIAIDSTVTTLTGSQTLTNKTLTSAVLDGAISGTSIKDEDNMASDSASHLATQQSIKAYVDAVSSGLDLKESSHTATTANLSADYNNGSSGVGATLTNNSTQAALSIDGQTMVATERVLVKDQTAGLQNGIYTVTTVGTNSTNWVLTRATDFDGSPSNEVESGSFTFVETGTTNADSGWVVTTDGTITIGTTAISWSQFSGAGQITAGTGLSKSGNTLSVDASQTQITAVGTIGTGVWNGTAVADAYVADDLTISGGTVNNSVIGGSTAAAGTFTQVDVEAQGDLRLQDTTGGQYVAIQAPGTISSSWTATLPAAVGSSGQALRTSDGSGTLEWFTPETGDITGVTAGTGLSGGGTSGTVTLNVDASQTQITAVGTIGTGVWQGTAVANAYLGTGIDATKLADGTVTNAELQYINTLSSNAQTQLDAKATKGFSIAMGVALG